MKLVKYEAACRALAEAKSVDEVKTVRDVAIAMQHYARQATNRGLEADAVEIRMRATRRLDQMRQEQKATVGLAKGAREPGTRRGLTRVDSQPASLAEAGIDKNLAHEARKLGALDDEEFEQAVSTAREAVSRVVKAALRTDHKAVRRAQREQDLAEKTLALPGRQYNVVVADPEWQWEPWSRKTGMDRAAANHYPTSILSVIAARDVQSISAKDSVLFLWATIPMLPHALTVMSAWGFDYKSHYCWGKDKVGTGYWSREKHELLLIGTRGNIPCPVPGDQWDSLIMAPRGRHSEKPECFLDMISDYYPNAPKIELNRRGPPRPGWDAWGLEAEAAE